jgi:methylated-DNA-[protein]-cysteine S-methyltransferase
MTFTEKVFEYVKTIPKGETRTYKEVAFSIGHPNSARAVGNALNKNYDLSIPCHRVVRSDGKTGGYNRGANKKISLLNQEQKN